ncbi:hypothetical protein LI99_18120 [Mycolicibacterium smegmatis]|uniref:Uncharacterized protein n=1 Tax=Mycolicibacterium smegmatis (strain ATCC 700084 / mc(2)155) TaxID=246196 RepID=A0QYF8_MYCS2|nr:hypothetical protein MSMEG_3643 [Mycolicibacterium smegmatis MC2 155]AIU08777.1 hypothetical protein LJ00_18115 [Mycolicibacterium smegmatis MC2 155]AIU15402.1 hypothetical protein LI99_18120 [Mycolicibacterium smegmatis]AIU22025.1 hypothetical protein LI98_18125 [Mycolicibacterium smegmatis]
MISLWARGSAAGVEAQTYVLVVLLSLSLCRRPDRAPERFGPRPCEPFPMGGRLPAPLSRGIVAWCGPGCLRG